MSCGRAVTVEPGVAGSAGAAPEDEAVLSAVERELSSLLRRATGGRVLAAYGHEVRLDLPAYSLLVRLFTDGPRRSGELARELGVDKSTMSRQVQALEREGLVERLDDPEDRRAALIQLSAEGSRSVQAERTKRRQALRGLLSAWSPEDRATFATLLARLNADVIAADRPG